VSRLPPARRFILAIRPRLSTTSRERRCRAPR
jgi:hypothetical protein